MFDYDKNIIWSVPIKSISSANLIIGFEAYYKELKDTNINPIIHQLDNEVLDNFITVIKKKGFKHQIIIAHGRS